MTIATLQARSKRHIFGEHQNKWIDGIQLDPQTFEWFMVSTYGGGVRENVGDLAPTSSNFNMLKIIVSSMG